MKILRNYLKRWKRNNKDNFMNTTCQTCFKNSKLITCKLIDQDITRCITCMYNLKRQYPNDLIFAFSDQLTVFLKKSWLDVNSSNFLIDNLYNMDIKEIKKVNKYIKNKVALIDEINKLVDP